MTRAWSVARPRVTEKSGLVNSALVSSGMDVLPSGGQSEAAGVGSGGGLGSKGDEKMLVHAPDAGHDTAPADHSQHLRALSVNLRAARRRAGWTQSQLAARSGLSFGWISGIELGRHVPCVENLVRLCLALGVSVDGVLGMGGER